MATIDVSIISSAHDLADARLHREAAALRRAGLSVEVIGLGDPAGGPAGCRVVSLGGRAGKAARLRRAAALPFRARGRVLLALDPDVVLTASLARLVWRRKLVADVHEDYSALLHDRAWARSYVKLAAQGLVRVATAVTRRADLTVVADDHVPPRKARRRLVVRNLPDPGYLPKPTEPDPIPRAIYVGDVRRSRGLQAMIQAVEAAEPWELDVVGPVHPDDQAWLAQWRASSPAARRVRIHGRLAPAKAWSLAAGAWVGLALLEDTPAFRAAIPTKLYEYLGSGLAVLATPLPRMAEIVRSSGAGAVVAGPEEASGTLQRWSERPEDFLAARKAALRWAEQNLAGESPYDQLAREIRDLVG
ncbi:glycosyl transferase [Carbonactinospora thermoautotrophica]|uniref:glycosyltransferase n=1 Tax=Carbonactinospora thermoautotrophica TaxID=1469144 RepID=UPI00226EC0E2|nr:glycosyltransferase [Carbonactinospora thermoautotrophica]MCX9190267.1 glycosyl transferase [Carbonactinospora thermoautotrophica]